jgi:hypothetical protein
LLQANQTLALDFAFQDLEFLLEVLDFDMDFLLKIFAQLFLKVWLHSHRSEQICTWIK